MSKKSARQTSLGTVVPITGNDSALCDVRTDGARSSRAANQQTAGESPPQFVDLASMSDSDANAMLDLMVERAASAGPFSTVLRMSSASARIVRERSPGNCRRESNVHINALTRDMNAGRFRLTGESLKFTKPGHFVDGHHRMIALSRAVASARVDFVAFFGMAEDAKGNIDQGNVRRPAAVLEKKTKEVSAVRAALSFTAASSVKTNKWTTDEIREGFARWESALRAVGPINCCPAPVWGVLIALYVNHPEKVQEFAAQIRAGAPNGCHSAARTLWDALQKIDAAGWENGFRVAILTMYATKAFILDRALSRFSPPSDLRETRTPNGIFTWFRSEAGAPLDPKQILDPVKLAEVITYERDERERQRTAVGL